MIPKQVIHDWIKRDLSPGMQMMILPEQVESLMDRVARDNFQTALSDAIMWLNFDEIQKIANSRGFHISEMERMKP